MRGWLVLGLLASLPAQGKVRAFVEVDAPVQTFLSQPVEVVITLGYDVDWFAEHEVPLFRQEADVPGHVAVPWLRADPERAVTVLAVPDPIVPAEHSRARVVLGDRLVDGRRIAPIERDGRSFARVQLLLRWLPLAAGATVLDPVRWRYAYATEFREHLLRGREPVDRQQGAVVAASRELRVLPLPKDSPPGWGGAVGEFEVMATSDAQEVRVGDVFSLEVRVTGKGNLDRFLAMTPPELDGFHVQGVVEKRAVGARVFVLDILALRPLLSAVPGVPFVAFSPAVEEYVTVLGPSVPMRVLPQLAKHASERVQALIDEDLHKQGTGIPAWVWRWGFIAVLVLGLCLHRMGRSNGRRALQRDLHELRVAVTGVGDAQRIADAFEQVVMRWSGESVFAAPGVWNVLRARGVADEVVAALCAVHEELVAARFGGPLPDRVAVMTAVDAVVLGVKV